MGFVVAFVITLLGLGLIWPGNPDGLPSGWFSLVILSLVISISAAGAIRFVNSVVVASSFAKLPLAVLLHFAFLTGLALLLIVVWAGLGIFIGYVFIFYALPYSPVAVLILFSFDYSGFHSPARLWRISPLPGSGRVAIGVGLLALPLVVVGVLLFSGPRLPKQIAFRRELRNGEAAIARIEAYQKRYGQLPHSLDQVGPHIAELEYQACLDGSYRVWFATSFDGTMTYDPATRKWKEGALPCFQARDYF